MMTNHANTWDPGESVLPIVPIGSVCSGHKNLIGVSNFLDFEIFFRKDSLQ